MGIFKGRMGLAAVAVAEAYRQSQRPSASCPFCIFYAFIWPMAAFQPSTYLNQVTNSNDALDPEIGLPPAYIEMRRKLEALTEGGGTVSDELHKARLCAMATLPFTNAGCSRTRRPGEQRQPAKRCSGCSTAKYCSIICQKKDWASGHKIACKLVATERGRG